MRVVAIFLMLAWIVSAGLFLVSINNPDGLAEAIESTNPQMEEWTGHVLLVDTTLYRYVSGAAACVVPLLLLQMLFGALRANSLLKKLRQNESMQILQARVLFALAGQDQLVQLLEQTTKTQVDGVDLDAYITSLSAALRQIRIEADVHDPERKTKLANFKLKLNHLLEEINSLRARFKEISAEQEAVHEDCRALEQAKDLFLEALGDAENYEDSEGDEVDLAERVDELKANLNDYVGRVVVIENMPLRLESLKEKVAELRRRVTAVNGDDNEESLSDKITGLSSDVQTLVDELESLESDYDESELDDLESNVGDVEERTSTLLKTSERVTALSARLALDRRVGASANGHS